MKEYLCPLIQLALYEYNPFTKENINKNYFIENIKTKKFILSKNY